MYLYERQDTDDFVNLFNNDFADIEKPKIRNKVIELRNAGQLEIKPNGRFYTGLSRWRRTNVLQTKILFPGKEYVLNNILTQSSDLVTKIRETINEDRQPAEKSSRKISTAEWIMIVLAIIGIIVTAIFS